MIKIAIYKQII